MYAWILCVTYLYSSMTAVTTTPAVYATKAECDMAAGMIRTYERRVVAECRAVKYVNRDNQQ
jgi:hypothetical protein